MVWVTYTDGIRLRSYSNITNINVKITRGEIPASRSAQCDVVVAGCVEKKRINAVGRVAVAGHIAEERRPTSGRVLVAMCVACERIQTGGRVVAAGPVAKERTLTSGRVEVAASVAIERYHTGGRVVAAICVAKER